MISSQWSSNTAGLLKYHKCNYLRWPLWQAVGYSSSLMLWLWPSSLLFDEGRQRQGPHPLHRSWEVPVYAKARECQPLAPRHPLTHSPDLLWFVIETATQKSNTTTQCTEFSKDKTLLGQVDNNLTAVQHSTRLVYRHYTTYYTNLTQHIEI